MTKVSLFSDGELLIVAAAISANGLIDLFDRKHKAGEMSVGQRAVMVFALLVGGPRAATFPGEGESTQVRHVDPGKVVERGPLAIFAASGYQDIKSDDVTQKIAASQEASLTAQEKTSVNRNANAALMFYVAALFAGLSCAILAATPGRAEV